jgi:hypothetical protein
MSLIKLLQKLASGDTEWQTQRRYERASNRSTEYMQVVQWYFENADEAPQIAEGYADLKARFAFRAGVPARLMTMRGDIDRKMGHAARITPGINPWIAVFRRPVDQTVYCIFVLLRDRGQQFAVMKPYWLLEAGESEADYMRPVVDGI